MEITISNRSTRVVAVDKKISVGTFAGISSILFSNLKSLTTPLPTIHLKQNNFPHFESLTSVSHIARTKVCYINQGEHSHPK